MLENTLKNPETSNTPFPIDFNLASDGDEWHVPATDTKGHYERFWIKVSPAVHNEVEIILHSGKFPYRTDAELLRHALIKHLVYLRGLQEVQGSVSGQVALSHLLIRHAEKCAEYDNLFSEATRVIFGGITDQEMRKGLLDQLQEALNNMPDGRWKEKYQEEFDKRFNIQPQS